MTEWAKSSFQAVYDLNQYPMESLWFASIILLAVLNGVPKPAFDEMLRRLTDRASVNLCFSLTGLSLKCNCICKIHKLTRISFAILSAKVGEEELRRCTVLLICIKTRREA